MLLSDGTAKRVSVAPVLWRLHYAPPRLDVSTSLSRISLNASLSFPSCGCPCLLLIDSPLSPFLSLFLSHTYLSMHLSIYLSMWFYIFMYLLCLVHQIEKYVEFPLKNESGIVGVEVRREEGEPKRAMERNMQGGSFYVMCFYLFIYFSLRWVLFITLGVVK